MTQSCIRRGNGQARETVQGAVPLALSVGPIAVRIRRSGEAEQAVIERFMMMNEPTTTEDVYQYTTMRADAWQGCHSPYLQTSTPS
jgi:hypothetical protein